jgi:hypothetical protein
MLMKPPEFKRFYREWRPAIHPATPKAIAFSPAAS